MCLTPVYIPNPTYSRSSYVSEEGITKTIPSNLTPRTPFIEVPCGKCADCRASYYNSILQRALVESRTSYMYFVTLTYDNEHMPVITLPTGEDVYYTDYNDVQLMFKRLRNSGLLGRDFRYLCVNEFGDRYGRPHVHLLLFVAKCSDDTLTTPHFIRQTLFNTLGKFFARNVGTRKQPVYDPLFTYRYRVTSTGPKTNYFVQYVEPRDTYNIYNISESDTFVKTIRYLIGYVNKGSALDTYISSILDDMNDTKLADKLRFLLRSKIRFSKGFGCGFENGRKIYLPRISVRSSSNTLLYTDVADTMPKEYSRFVDLYPDLADDLQRYIQNSRYHKYKTLQKYFENISTYDYYLHCLLIYYFPRYFDRLYTRCYRSNALDKPTISYFFNKCQIPYKKCKLHTSPIEDSLTYRLLRSGVEQGIVAGVPFLAFKTTQGFTALCKFYKERVTTLDDIHTLYSRLGVKSYEDWKALFVRQLDLRKANQQAGNKFLQENDEKVCNNQKKYLHLPRRVEKEDLYRTLFSN